jgi:hypothetical protein
MHSNEFKPKYKFSAILGFATVIPLSLIIILAMILMDAFNIIVFAILLLFFSCIFLVPFTYYKKITFKDSSLELDRYIIAPKIILYSDIKDIGLQYIITKRGNIAVNGMENEGEFRKMLYNKIAEGSVQIEAKQIAKDTVSFKALAISFPISFIGAFVLKYAGYYPENVNPKVVYFIIWVICAVIAYYIVKKSCKTVDR